jgi:LysR family transcriptional activator of nhaA
MEWINFRHLYAFWSVCRYGGFKHAAEKLFVSQSTISEQVSQLEEYFDEKLLERTTRSISVSERGTALLKYADEIFSKSYEINHIFRDKNESLVPSQIRIGMVGGISRNFVFGLVFQNLIQERGTRIEVVDGSFEDLNQLLKSHEIELILSLEPPRKKDLLALSYKQIESSPLCIAGSPDLIRRIKRRRRQTLQTELYMFRHHFEGEQLQGTIASQFNLDGHVPVTTDDISLLRFLANSGRGVAVLPEIGVMEDLNSGQLSRVRLNELPPIDFYAVFLKNGFHRELIDEFLA